MKPIILLAYCALSASGVGLGQVLDQQEIALERLRQAAYYGDAEAQFQLGMRHFEIWKSNSRWYPKEVSDFKKATELFEKSAAQGNPKAKAKLFEIAKNTYTPVRNEMQWFERGVDGKIRALRIGVYPDKEAMSNLTVGNGNEKAALGKLIDILTDSKVCEFVVLPKSSIKLEHIPDGRYRFVFSIGDEIVRGTSQMWNPASVEQFEEPIVFQTTTTIYTRVKEWPSQTITLHGVAGGNVRTKPLGQAEFAKY